MPRVQLQHWQQSPQTCLWAPWLQAQPVSRQRLMCGMSRSLSAAHTAFPRRLPLVGGLTLLRYDYYCEAVNHVSALRGALCSCAVCHVSECHRYSNPSRLPGCFLTCALLSNQSSPQYWDRAGISLSRPSVTCARGRHCVSAGYYSVKAGSGAHTKHRI